MRKLSIRRGPHHALRVTRHALAATRLVYVAVANKPLKYRHGERSKIAYIGQTRVGLREIANAAAKKAPKILKDPGVNTLEFFPVTCRKRKKVATWEMLEYALILTFRDRFGDIPRLNIHGKHFGWSKKKGLKDLFASGALSKAIDYYSKWEG